MSDLLLQTKLFKPALRPALINRTHLINRLNEGLGVGTEGFAVRLTLVCAPAGFGKTTLVAAWLAQLTNGTPQFSDGVTAWLSLDESDNDPVRFLTYLIAALQTAVPGLGEAVMRFLQSPQPPSAATILTTLINDITQYDRPLILVLEDYHVITTATVHQALTFLLDHLPPLLHLLIITRSDPPLPLSRLRAGGELTEIRAADLRFSTNETAVFLNQSRNLDLADEEIAALAERIDGWIAGLHLVALSMQNHADPATFITSFTGNSRYIVDYLVDEVLQQRPYGTKQFLLQTAILNPFCASLCEAVTGQQDGQATLERLEEANLFITALDEDRLWYRYHPLFAEVLQARLLQTQRDHLPELYRRAAGWHTSQGMVPEAVRYALAGADFAEAARLIERLAESMLLKGAGVTLVRWLDAMPIAMIRAHPHLCLARAWTFLWGPTPRLDQIEEWVQRALPERPGTQPHDTSLTGAAIVLQATAAAIQWDIARSRTLSRQALDHLSSDSPWRSVMTLCLGTAHFYAGDIVAASRVLADALRLSQAEGSHYIQFIAAAFLADIQVLQGHLSHAADLYQQILVWSEQGPPQRGTVMAHSGLANILCERNHLEAARTHLQLGGAQLEQVGGAWVALAHYRALARLQQAQGNWVEAFAALEQVTEIGQSTQVTLIVTQAAVLSARLRLAHGDVAAAGAWAANSELNVDDLETSYSAFKEEAYLSLAHLAHAEGRHAEALSLLERLLPMAEAEGRTGSIIAILILQGLIWQTQAGTARALTFLARALILAEAEGYIRIFVDEGEPLRVLLSDYHSQLATQSSASSDDLARRLLTYTHRLLVSFSAMPSVPQPDPYRDALSERELEVLRLVATGASNREIANALFLAVATVKKHISNIMSKLNARSRTQAVAEARTLDLL